jgi:hypothetical protein
MSTSMGHSVAGEGPAPKVGPHEPALLRRPLDNCPRCGSWQLQPVVDIDASGVHFLCGSCSRCWRVELGYVRRVPPTGCEGCPQQELCAASWAKDHAST